MPLAKGDRAESRAGVTLNETSGHAGEFIPMVNPDFEVEIFERDVDVLLFEQVPDERLRWDNSGETSHCGLAISSSRQAPKRPPLRCRLVTLILVENCSNLFGLHFPKSR
jgi:hypothetical protein